MAAQAQTMGSAFPARTIFPVVLGALALMVTHAAHAHPPYERIERTLPSRPDGKVQLVKSYVDGIFSVDPVKLVLRDASSGEDLAETEYVRDLVLSCDDSDQCIAFLFASTLSFMPSRTYTVRGPALVYSGRNNSLLGVAAHLADHWIGYLVSAAVGLLICIAALLSARGWTRLVAVGGAASVLFFWFYAVAALSRLLLPMAAAAFGMGVSAYVLWFARWKKERVVETAS